MLEQLFTVCFFYQNVKPPAVHTGVETGVRNSVDIRIKSFQETCVYFLESANIFLNLKSRKISFCSICFKRNFIVVYVVRR